jgi:hypothetical protein
MRCPSCNKSISQKDRFCRHCGGVVTADDIEAGRQREDARWHGQLAQGIIARHQSEAGTWGAHIYRTDSTSNYPRSRPPDCPAWVEARDWHRWFHEGLVVWDNTTQRIGALSSGEAVKLAEAILRQLFRIS